MLAKKGVNYDKLPPLTRLALVSNNGLGGLTYEPSLAEKTDDISYNLDSLAREVNTIFDEKCSDNVDLDAIFRLGGSSGGARPKAHIKMDDEDWIVKFPCRIDPHDIGKKEFEANVSAQACGIQVNRLLPAKFADGA